jgi:hypothetical protein
MARRRNPPELVRTKWQLADRIRLIRTELYGERGLAELAKQVGVPVRTWYSYETGVTVPAETLLRFIELTHVEPVWLLHGTGNKFVGDHGPLGSRATFTSAGGDAENGVGAPADGRDRGTYFAVDLPNPDLALDHEMAMAVALVDGPPTGLGAPIGAPLSLFPAIRRTLRCIRMEDDSMLPIIVPAAFVAYSDTADEPDELEGKMVVAHLGNRILVRWYHRSGNYAVLRAENPQFDPRTELVDLRNSGRDTNIRRVLWIGTAH